MRRTRGGQTEAHAPDEVEMILDVWNAPKTTPAWLGEHVNDVYPALTTGRAWTAGGKGGALTWPRFNGSEVSLRPSWAVELSAIAENPRAKEGDKEPPKTGKWKWLELTFKWWDDQSDMHGGDFLNVDKDFMAQALTGRAIEWA